MKISRLFLAAFPVLLLASCSDDKGLPDVSYSANIYGYYYVDGESTRYVVQGDELVFGSVDVTSADGADAGIANITYGINGLNYFSTSLYPFACVIPTSYFGIGNNVVTLDMTIAVVGYEVAQGWGEYNFVCVADDTDLPAGAIYVPVPDDESQPDNPESPTV